jgi:hypothetical protein
METWSIERLTPYARNPRKNDAAVERMCSSIHEFGFKIPCLVRSDGEVIDGHLRLKAARQLNTTEIPVILFAVRGSREIVRQRVHCCAPPSARSSEAASAIDYAEQVCSQRGALRIVRTIGLKKLEEALLHHVFGIRGGTGHPMSKPV